MKNSSCQVNIKNDKMEKFIQELKLKINNLENEKGILVTQLNENQKKYEEKIASQNKDINTLSLLNNKLKKNLEKVNTQVTKLLNQIVVNNSNHSLTGNNKLKTKAEKEKSKNKEKNIEEKETNNEIKELKEKLKLKESQVKESLQTIELLRKENKQLKDDYESLCSDGKNINQNHKLIEEIKKKNFEIRELEKEYKNIISSKSEDAQLEYYKKKVNDLKIQNDESKAKINQLKQIVEKHQKKENENKKNSNLNSLNATQLKNNQAKIEKIKIKKEGKIEYIINDSNSKKYILNKNFSLLFNDLEKKILCTLFQ